MPLTLRISFSGLCLFVPRANESGVGMMHVLLPKADLGHHPEHNHFAVVAFNTAHVRRGSKGLDPANAHVRLDGHTLQVGSGTPNLRICSGVANLKALVSGDLDDDLFGSDTAQRLAGRVTIGAGAMSAVERGACWAWEAGVRTMTHYVKWTIPGITETSLNLQLVALDGSSTVDVPELHPIAHPDTGEEIIDIAVLHLPAVDLLPAPPVPVPDPGTPALHFNNYYKLFTPLDFRLPLFLGENVCSPASDCPVPDDKGGSAFNCVVAGVY